MTFEPGVDPIAQILEIAAKALYSDNGSSAAAQRLRMSVRLFLQEQPDIDAALSIVVAVGDELGLIPRDHGKFMPRTNAETDSADEDDQPTDDDEGRAPDASQEAAAILPGSSSTPLAGKPKKAKKSKKAKKAKAAPSAARQAAMSSVADTMVGAFAMKARNGIEIGNLRHSQLNGLIGANALENEILDRVRNFGAPPTDLMIHEYVPLPEFEKMVTEAKAAISVTGHA